MNHMTLRQGLVTATMLMAMASTLQSCRTASSNSNASLKDSTLSPSDVTKPTTVLWLTSDNQVHIGVCPAHSSVVNRNCPAIAESEAPMPISDYKDKLKEAITKASSAANGNVTADPAMAKALEEKIQRLNDKINAGTYSAADIATFKKQIDSLNAELKKVSPAVTQQEDNQLFNRVIDSLNAGQDVTFDQGERLYNLAQMPFLKGFLVYRMVILAGESGACSNTIVINSLKYQIDGALEVIQPNQRVSDTESQVTLKASPAVVKSSTSWGPTNDAAAAFGTAQGSGWAPKGFLDASGLAQSLQFIQIEFTAPVGLSGVSFVPANAQCAVKSFRIDGSADGTNFSPVPNGEWISSNLGTGAPVSFQW